MRCRQGCAGTRSVYSVASFPAGPCACRAEEPGATAARLSPYKPWPHTYRDMVSTRRNAYSGLTVLVVWTKTATPLTCTPEAQRGGAHCRSSDVWPVASGNSLLSAFPSCYRCLITLISNRICSHCSHTEVTFAFSRPLCDTLGCPTLLLNSLTFTFYERRRYVSRSRSVTSVW